MTERLSAMCESSTVPFATAAEIMKIRRTFKMTWTKTRTTSNMARPQSAEYLMREVVRAVRLLTLLRPSKGRQELEALFGGEREA